MTDSENFPAREQADRILRVVASLRERSHYFVQYGDEPEREVDAEEFIWAERKAGFYPEPGYRFATGGFETMSHGGIKGRIEIDPPEPTIDRWFFFCDARTMELFCKTRDTPIPKNRTILVRQDSDATFIHREHPERMCFVVGYTATFRQIEILQAWQSRFPDVPWERAQ